MSQMPNNKIIIFLLIFFISIPAMTESQVISGPEVRHVNNDIYVTFSLNLVEKNMHEIKEGIDKEFKFYIDLFKVWKNWPDEFVLGKFYARTLKSDPIKKEYVASSGDGITLVKKRFKSLETMLDWVVSVRDLKLTNTRELEPGQYFIKITVESKIRKLPPVIGYPLSVFFPENEFRVIKNSSFFTIEAGR